MSTFRPGDRVHLKGHARTPATTGTVTEVRIVTIIFVRWDDNQAITPHHPQHLEPAGEPMSADPRIEAAAVAIASKVHTRDFDVMATAALAAADKAATITTVEDLDALPVGTVVVSDGYQYSLTYPNYKVSFQRLYDGEWHRGCRASSTHPENILPARVIHWGTE